MFLVDPDKHNIIKHQLNMVLYLSCIEILVQKEGQSSEKQTLFCLNLQTLGYAQ